MTKTLAASPIVTLDKNHHGLAYRVPNKTGQGDHTFTAHARIDYNGKTYSAQVYQTGYNLDRLGCLETMLYLNGRAIPEMHLTALRGALIIAYRETFEPLPARAEHAEPFTADHDRESIDLTPTWSGMLRLLLAAYEGGTFEGRKAAEGELTRMAALADKHVAANSPAPDLVRVYLNTAAPTALGSRTQAKPEPVFTGSPADVAAYLRAMPLGQSVEVRNARNIRSCLNKPALWEWVETLTAEAL